MDNVSRDRDVQAVLASELITLLNGKVRELREALEDHRNGNMELPEDHPQALGTRSADTAETQRHAFIVELGGLLVRFKDQVERREAAMTENRHLHEEIDRLREELRTARPLGEISVEDDEKPPTGCLGEHCPASQKVRDLSREVERLEQHLADNDAVMRAKNLEHEIELGYAETRQMEAEREVVQLHEAIEGLRSRMREIDAMWEQLGFDLRPKDRGENDHEELEHEAHSNESDSEAEAEDESDDHNKLGVADEGLHDTPVSPNYRPDNVACISHKRGPWHLPAHIRQLSTATGGVLFWPGRTLWPLDGNRNAARIFATKSKCDPSSWTWTRARHRLSRFVGKTHELFVHAGAQAVCYAGTFRCVRRDVFSPAQFRQLSDQVKSDIYMQCVGGAAVFDSLPKRAKNKLRRTFNCGHERVEYIQLEFVTFNHKYFNAMLQLEKEEDGQAATKKRKHRDQSEGGREAKKRARTVTFSDVVGMYCYT